MKIKSLTALFMIGSLVAGSTSTFSADESAANQTIKLSTDLLNLLRAEMREISNGVQGVAFSLATADWESIEDTATKIRASYIMEKKLTPAQADELKTALPEQFKKLDAEFHQRAEKLGAAATAHDPELVAFHFSRLIENCAHCHSAYAIKRFPEFSSQKPLEHHH